MLAEARAEAENSLKTSKQKMHRKYRETLEKLEKEAADEAESIVSKGEKEAEEMVRRFQDRINDVADWVAKEVVNRYGGPES